MDCQDVGYQPQWFAEEHMTELEDLLADAIEESEERASLRYCLRASLRRRNPRP
ncbi:hypothetical protein ACWGEU_23240 [Streptomyces goshikiensis]